MTYYQPPMYQMNQMNCNTSKSISNINGIQVEIENNPSINNGRQTLFINGKLIQINEPITSIKVVNPMPSQQRQQFYPQQMQQQGYMYNENNVNYTNNINYTNNVNYTNNSTYQTSYQPQQNIPQRTTIAEDVTDIARKTTQKTVFRQLESHL